MNRKARLAVGGAVALAAGRAVERLAVERRRRNDPSASEEYGSRRGVRARKLQLEDGAEIFIEEAGPESRRGAVFIHGSALRTDQWYHQLPGLADHRLIFYDLRGHGLSRSRGEAEFSIRTLARDLLAVVEDCNLEQLVLVGHSIGGMVALELCHIRPDLVGSPIVGLVLVNTTYRPAVETLAGGALIARLERITRHPFDSLKAHSERIERLRKITEPADLAFWIVRFFGFGPKAPAKVVDFTYEMMSETDAELIFDLIKSYRAFDVRGALADIRIPALVIGGGCDRLTLPEASEFIAENLPDAKLSLLPNCGHMLCLEQPEEFNDLLKTFLDRTLGEKQARSAEQAVS